MPAAETAKLIATLDLNTGQFTKGLKNATASMGKFSASIAKSRAVAVGLGVGLERAAEKGISALGDAIGDGIQAALTLEKAQAQTAAVITSTGHAAGVTADQVRSMAEALEDVTTADDKSIQQGENLLLTFTNIGSKTFPDATKAMVNYAIAMNKGDAATADFDSAAIQLGKALNDPVKGFNALARNGVAFDAAQTKILKGTNSLSKEETKHYNQLRKSDKAAAERYKKTVLANKLLKSQQVILGELNKEFGKAGEAAGTGFAADISRANDAIEDAKIAIAQGLIPAVGEVARELSTVLKDPAVIRGLKDFGTGIGAAIKGLVAFAKTVPWSSIANSLQAAAGFAKDLLNAFLGLPDWVKTAVITGWGLNKLTGGALNDLIGSLATGLIKGVLGINAGVVHLSAASVVGGPGIGTGVPTPAGGGGGLITTLKSLVLPVTIAAITVEAAGAIANALDPTATGPGQQPLFNRDPERFDEFGRVIRNSIPDKIDLDSGNLDSSIAKNTEAIDRLNLEKPFPTGLDGRFPGKDADDVSKVWSTKASTTDITDLKGKLSDDLTTVNRSTTSVENAVKAADQQISSSGQLVQGAAALAGYHAAAASTAAGAAVVTALGNLAPPIVQVFFDVTGASVHKTNTVISRNGPIGGSATDNDPGTGQGHGGP